MTIYVLITSWESKLKEEIYVSKTLSVDLGFECTDDRDLSVQMTDLSVPMIWI